MKSRIYWGTPDFAVPPLRALVKAGYTRLWELLLFLLHKPKGRSKTLLPPVKEEALKYNIPVYLQSYRTRVYGNS